MNRHQIDPKRAELAAEADTILTRADGPMTDAEKTRRKAIEAELEDLKVAERAFASLAAGGSESGDGSNPGGGFQHLQRQDPWDS
jgi:hypothetical protein